jgi:hypothetical protein
MPLGSEAILYDVDGSLLPVDNGVPYPADTPTLIMGGSDGTNARYILVDSSGRQILVGAGVAGTPAGGVISIQGVAGGTAIPVSGTVTTINPSVGSNDSAIPTSSTQIGGSDGTNLRALRAFDLDSGGGQQWILGVGLRKSAGGGSVELGTSSDPIRIDPTGSTTQPVSGTVAATQSGTWTVQPGNTANTTPWLITISQGGNAATVTGANALKIDGSAVTQPVSGTITANAGTGNFTVIQSTASNLRAQLASESSTGVAIPSTALMVGGSDGTNLRALFLDSSGRQIIIGAAANGAAVAGNPVLIAGSDGTNARSIRTATDGTVRVDPTGTTTQPVSDAGASLTIDTTQLPAALVGGRLDANIGAWLGSTAPTVGSKTSANSIPVVVASDQGTITVNASATVGIVDNAAFTDGTTRIQPVGFIFDEVAGTALTENDGAAARVDSKRAQVLVIEDATTRGTRTTVKAASTAAVAADPALVVAISPNNTITSKETRSSTTSVSSVAASASSVALLASNTNRLGATIYNDSNQTLYVQLGATASTTSFVVKMNKDDYYEIPFNYTGVINGIWSSASGSARIVELS